MQTDSQLNAPATAAPRPVAAAIIAGLLGAVVLWIIQMVMASGGGNPPTGTAVAMKLLQMQGIAAWVVGAVLFFLAGAVWGAIYGAVAPRINALTGAIFGLVPWLFVMLALLPILGKPLFAGGAPMGIVMPLILNVLWGLITGALTPMLLARGKTV